MMAKQKGKTEHIFCPYCDAELKEKSSPLCNACKVTIFYCPRCRKPLSRDNKVCPHCGAEIV